MCNRDENGQVANEGRELANESQGLSKWPRARSSGPSTKRSRGLCKGPSVVTTGSSYVRLAFLSVLMMQIIVMPLNARTILNAGNPDAKRLYDDLLSNYNKLVRPVVNTTDILLVMIKLKLSQLIDVVCRQSYQLTNLYVHMVKFYPSNLSTEHFELTEASNLTRIEMKLLYSDECL